MTVRQCTDDFMAIEGPSFTLEVIAQPEDDRPGDPIGVMLSHGGDGDPADLTPQDVAELHGWLGEWLRKNHADYR